ncbi:PDDEXK nuclease domain-containing protein [Sinomonas sp. JGH33]|uniref:PDDEXK nuclease domain-containing protein n=1 Tax=Sinomonas terricola TaxID=3110330 RepID=A0ABU5TC89_9MICC|nr:PDDEXK nuclease domain-containing protein [Sinomonas sp. JGH33]MEA5457305.1 PDDEXK nuclease domain-containing protein [Sinomonas sp. JGH33]
MSELEPDLPAGYAEVLAAVKNEVRSARTLARRAANTAMLQMYWKIGRTILDQQSTRPWGSKVLERLALDLRAEFPKSRGFSRSNLSYMRAFAAAWDWPEGIVQSDFGQLPWGHVIELLKLKEPAARDWYAARAVERGWKLEQLQHQIHTGLHLRTGAAPNNLEARIPDEGEELVGALAKDPLVLDFLGLDDQAEESAMEEALTLRMTQTLAELGPGFSFVGRQFPLDVDGDLYEIDLLFFHWLSNRFVVLELKQGRFHPRDLGQLGFYVAAVNDMLRQPFHAPTVGILVCGSKNDRTVRYSLDGAAQPIAVTSYTYETLPAQERAALPSPAEISAALEREQPQALEEPE